jgi:hypothetical protein
VYNFGLLSWIIGGPLYSAADQLVRFKPTVATTIAIQSLHFAAALALVAWGVAGHQRQVVSFRGSFLPPDTPCEQQARTVEVAAPDPGSCMPLIWWRGWAL